MSRKWEKQLQEQLKSCYTAPPPKRKREFLASVSRMAAGHQRHPASFLWMQAGYIRKWNWALSAAVFLAGFGAARSGRRELFQMLAALMPFLALTLATETGRSARYGMEELELAARHSLKAVVAARMGILGLENLLLMGILIPLLRVTGKMSLWQTGCALLIPYFLSAFLQMAAVRKLRGPEGMYVCFGISVLVSGLTAAGTMVIRKLAEYLPAAGWLALLLVLAVLALREGIKYMRQAEEYVWS